MEKLNGATEVVFEGLKVDKTQTDPKLNKEALSVYVLIFTSASSCYNGHYGPTRLGGFST